MERNNATNNAEGVFNELSVAYHLKGQFPEHFRFGDGKAPNEMYNKIREILPEQATLRIDQHAKQSAFLVTQYLAGKQFPTHEDYQVFWTSNPSDYGQLMDMHNVFEKNKDSNADLVLVSKKKVS